MGGYAFLHTPESGIFVVFYYFFFIFIAANKGCYDWGQEIS